MEIPARFAEYLNIPRVMAHTLRDDGSIPNNQRLPLLIYQGAFQLRTRNPAPIIEEVFDAHGWGGSWRDGIYPFHHYHSTAHEVLAVYRGSATVQFGGEQGLIQPVRAGDVVLIPAGVGHKNLGAEAGFAVVGAYPAGQTWDMCYGKPGERPGADENIARVPLPQLDPVYGAGGPVLIHWTNH